MSSVLERMERQAHVFATPKRYTPITDIDVEKDVAYLCGVEIRNWASALQELREGRDPLALQGGIAGLEANPIPDALATFAFTASEQAFWAAATLTPIAMPIRSPVQFDLYTSGTITTVTSPGTMLFTPRIGVSTSGGTLGASNAISLTASVTGVIWQMDFDLTVRATGSGTNARAYGSGNFKGKLATAGTGAADQDILFGYTAATFDSTAASGLFMGLTGSVTTPTAVIQQLRWGSWN